MKSIHSRLVLAIIVAAALSAGAARLGAQNRSADLRIYKGEPIDQAGVALQSWGSGEARESEEKVYIGNKSIKVTTHGRYQGARLVLQNPLNLKAVQDDKFAYLVLTMALAARDSSGSMGLGNDYGSMFGRPGAGGQGRFGAMFGRPGLGQGQGQGQGAEGDLSGKMSRPKPISKLRVVLVSTDDKKMESWLPIETAVPVREDWKQIAVPVAAIGGLKDSSGVIKELEIFGDSPAILYLGEVRVMRDETPIRADDLPERTVAVNDSVQFTGSAEAGVTPLVYEWDFDDSDGIGVDKVGKTVSYKYRKSRRDPKSPMGRDSAAYTVTLTVRDQYGLKQPIRRTTKVLVTL